MTQYQCIETQIMKCYYSLIFPILAVLQTKHCLLWTIYQTRARSQAAKQSNSQAAKMSDSDEEELDKETVGKKVENPKISFSELIKIFHRQQKSFPQKGYKSIRTYFHFLTGMNNGFFIQY